MLPLETRENKGLAIGKQRNRRAHNWKPMELKGWQLETHGIKGLAIGNPQN